MKLDHFFIGVLVGLSLLMVPSPSDAQAIEEMAKAKIQSPPIHTLSLGGGLFNPSDGESGSAFLGQFMIKMDQKHLGFELEIRDFETTLFDVPEIEIRSFVVRGVAQYFFRLEGVSPYIGGGIGLSVNIIDGAKVEQGLSQGGSRGVNVEDIGSGFGIMALVGIEIPLTSRAVLFMEGRVSGDFQFTTIQGRNTSGEDELEIENVGGVTALGGIRFWF